MKPTREPVVVTRKSQTQFRPGDKVRYSAVYWGDTRDRKLRKRRGVVAEATPLSPRVVMVLWDGTDTVVPEFLPNIQLDG